MVTGLVSKQVRSRPVIYDRIVQGRRELADSLIYQKARKRGKKGRLARGMLSAGTEEEEEESDREMDIERQEGKREVEKFVHGIRNGEIV
eukprot:2966382-Pleurochrysis_carterae.AAC.1